MPRPICLVGLRGSGKTTVGRCLAAHLQRSFLDLDEALEREQGVAIPDLFARLGEPGFRALEADLVEVGVVTKKPTTPRDTRGQGDTNKQHNRQNHFTPLSSALGSQAAADVACSCKECNVVWNCSSPTLTAISEPGRVSRKKVPLAAWLKSTRPS